MAGRQLPSTHPSAHRRARLLSLLSGSSALALVVAAGPAMAGGPIGQWTAAGAAPARWFERRLYRAEQLPLAQWRRTAINDTNGLLVSNDGAVTLVGDEIQQKGGIEVTTSVTRPGSISFSTSNPSSGVSGDIILDRNSITAITPDASSGSLPSGSLTSTPTYFQDNIQPKITITATGSVDVRGGALVSAPSAALTISTPSAESTVLLETGSLIDLSGLSDVTLPMSKNEVPILVTANEVADDPLAQSLIGKTVVIDARLSGTRADGFHWVGSPILDAAGFIGTIPKSINEFLTVGGSFKVSGPQNFIQQSGAAIDVSGGAVTYLGGMINTTKLVGADGHIYDIGSANPNIAYLGVTGGVHDVFVHAHWGVTEFFTSPLFGSSGRFEAGYVTGRSAGSVGIAANVPILEGSISANTVTGQRQSAGLDPLPTGGSLNIAFNNLKDTANLFDVVLEPQFMAGSDPYGLSSFQFGSTWNGPNPFQQQHFPIFSDILSAPQFGSIAIFGENQLNMPAGASLSVRPGGSITLAGVSSIDGALTAPGGKINLSGFAYLANLPQHPPTEFLVIGPDAVIDVRGRWVNDTGLAPDQIQGAAFVDGGSVSISTQAASVQDGGNYKDVTQSIILATGVVIDVSSGGYIASNGKIKIGSDGLPVGKGGSLALVTYNNGWVVPPTDGSTPSNIEPTSTNVPNQANVMLGGSIYAWRFDGGGTFALQAPTVTIDGAAPTLTSYLAQATVAKLASRIPGQLGVAASDARSGEIVLPASFFANSGFSQYTLNSTYGSTTVTAGTDLKLQQATFLPVFLREATGGSAQFGTGALVRDFAPIGEALTTTGLPKPVSLTLVETSFQTAAPGDVASGGILIDSGASIEATAGATVSLVAGGPVTVLGSITAPAGTINLFNNPSLTDVGNGPLSQAPSAVWIGSAAKLDVTGVIATNPLVPGSVTLLDGGTITLGGSGSSTVVVKQGAQLALGGASGFVNIPGAPNLSQPSLVSTPVWSNGGALQLAAGSIYFAGTVNAAGGAPNAAGGRLTIGDIPLPAAVQGFKLSLNPATGNLDGPMSVVIEPSGDVAQAFTAPPSTSPSTIGFITAETLNNSGFDSIGITANTIGFASSLSVAVPGALTLAAQSGHFVLLPAGITDPTQYLPPPCANCVPMMEPSGQPTVRVDLQAAYVHLIGRDFLHNGSISAPNLADGTLNVKADWIDLQRTIAIDDAADVNFTSTGAIRLLPDNYGFIGGSEASSRPTYSGALLTPGNLTLTASEVVPVTATQFLLMSLGALPNDSTLTVSQSQNSVATAPLSAGGTIVLDAQAIKQDGTLWAPLGNIVIGLKNKDEMPSGLAALLPAGLFTATQSVNLGDPNDPSVKSLTSVSAAGLQIPFGYTIDGQTWYQGTPNINNANLGTALTAPPAKAISLFGGNIVEASNATLDAGGGGDVYATEFTAGTGGTRNVLTTYEINLAASNANNVVYTSQYADGRQVYALVPSYEAKVAAYDPTFANYPYYSGVSVPAGTNLSGFTPGGSGGNALFLGNGIAPGASITISDGSGIAGGSYVLLPGMYATLPGAFLVVQVASNVSPIAASRFFNADGSVYVTGRFGNALTGTNSALPSEFQLQSNAAWQRHSLISMTSGTSFFPNQAMTNGTAVPPLPIDGGILTIGATSTLKLDGSNIFTPAAKGLGGQIDISAQNILIVTDDQKVPAADQNYLVLTADLVSKLGAAATVLIGGTASFDATGERITAEATNLEVLTDAAHPLTGADLTLVSTAGDSNGLTVDQGSVIAAVGPVTSGPARNITIGSSGSGDGALLRVANAPLAIINRLGVPATPLGKITIGTTPGTSTLANGGTPVEINGGNALTVDTSGTSVLAPDTALTAKNYDLSGSVINLGAAPAKAAGLTLTSNLIASFAGATSVSLRSASFFNFYDAAGLTFGDAANPIGTLTLSGSGIYHSTGGTTTIEATNIVLADSQIIPTTKGALTGTGGTLTIAAADALFIDVGTTASTNNTLTMFLGGTGTGNKGNFGSFGQVNLTGGGATSVPWMTSTSYNAGQTVNYKGADYTSLTDKNLSVPGADPTQWQLVFREIAFVGIGSSFTTTATTNSGATVSSVTTNAGVLNAGLGNVTLTAPVIGVAGGSAQSLATAGNLTLAPGASAANRKPGLGGSLALTAGNITDSASILAPSGVVTLTATGDIHLESGASISATGSAVTVLDQIRYAPGGSVLLAANAGNVTIDPGAIIDVSAAGNGYAGSLAIQAHGQATLNGALNGSAAFNDLGVSLTAGSLAGTLPFSNFTGGFAVTLAQGDIAVGATTTLTSKQVTLTANNGSVIVDGTIDASGPSGSQISLYGTGVTVGGVTTGGVTIDAGAQLLVRFKADDPADPAYANGTSSLVQNGGTITLSTTGAASGTVNATYGYENVASSGAITVASGAILDVSGGPGGANISNTGGQVILRAPILADGSVNVGFHGTLVTNIDRNGSAGGGVVVDGYATWSTADACTSAACASQHFDGIIDPAGWFLANGTQISGQITHGDIFTPTVPVYQPHVDFFQSTLKDFVQSFSATADFKDAQLSAGGATPVALPAALVHQRPEIALVSPDTATNSGNITVASNWNIGAGTFDKNGNYAPFYRTIAGEAGTLTLRAANNVAINATISDGFYETQDAFGGSVLVANQIANNPQAAGTANRRTVFDLNTTAAASLMSIGTGNLGSFSYDFVAGAAGISGAPSANPDAVIPVASLSKTITGDVTINGHTSYHNSFFSLGEPPTINIPTLVRTGTGSITVTAAGNFELLDKTTPGAIYTAGAVAATPSASVFTPPTVPSTYTSTPNGLVGTPAWAMGGGSVSIVVGESIIGIETPTDGPAGGHTGVPGGPTGQFWSDWYDHYGLSNGGAPFDSCPAASCQTAAWVNYATFFQGVGALGGGNVSLVAGKDITDIGASLPETLVVSGGILGQGPPVATYFGGGNLTVKAAGNINSSDFLVGRGSGIVQAGGAIQFDAKNPITGRMTVEIDVAGSQVSNTSALPLLLAVQDGFITLGARGSVTLGNVYDPASLPLDASVVTPSTALPGGFVFNNVWSNLFTTYGPQSGIAISSTGGDVTALTVATNANAGLLVHNDQASINDQGVTATTIGLMLPATMNIVALSGNVAINPSTDVGSANLVPSPPTTGINTANLSVIAAKSIDLGSGIAMPDLVTSPLQFVGNLSGLDYTSYISPLGQPLPSLTQALHAQDLNNPAVIAAGQDINAVSASVSLIKPAQIEAGNNILGGPGNGSGAPTFTGQNNDAGDITSIAAGHDLVGGTYALYGPGVFVLQAGRNMGPFEPSGTSVNGVVAIGNGTNIATAYGQSFAGRTYLPAKSADIYALFGVGPGIDYQGAITAFVDPTTPPDPHNAGINFLSDIAGILGKAPGDAWLYFKGLPAAQKNLLVDRAFLDFLFQVANDYRDSASPYFGHYARAYTAIETLFPASLGYTDNTTGTGNGAATTVQTGSLNIARSVIETQMGGDINLIGPGGGITVGSAARDVLAPVQEGILTLAGGTIRAFTDASILLNQSRILTPQGGDIDLFTANGSINAGEGPSTYVSDPPISVICDQSGFCKVNPSGLVSGAGIGALLTLPGQDQSKSKVTLVAPRGIIDAGAAGLRAGGGLNLIAQQVLNAYNIAAGGSVQGVPSGSQAPTSAVTSSAATTGTTQQNLGPSTQTTTGSTGQPSIIIVEVLGYGGGEGGGTQDQDDEQNRRRQQQ